MCNYFEYIYSYSYILAELIKERGTELHVSTLEQQLQRPVDHSTRGVDIGGAVVVAPEYAVDVLLLKFTGKPVTAADGG
jgi:hypothetical protein